MVGYRHGLYSLKGKLWEIVGNAVALCISNLKKKVALGLFCHNRRVLWIFFAYDEILVFVGFQLRTSNPS